MTTIKIDGKPLVVFTFDHLPSVNEEINKARRNRFVAADSTKEWRATGKYIAGRFMSSMKDEGLLIKGVALVIVTIYRARKGRYDVTNPYVKALMDGFTEAEIWPDDDWSNLPYVMFRWKHLDLFDYEGQRFEVEIHELEDVVENGMYLILPKGRFTKEGERI